MAKVELLAPAGNREQLEAAIRYGADAVYVGGPKMQLRAGNTGFSVEALADAVRFAHDRGKLLYVAVNAFARNDDILGMAEYAGALRDIGIDAAIVSDLGAIRAIKRAAPDLPVHVSTQANCLNYEAASVYYELGATRVVLGREMTIEQIAELRSRAPKGLEIEAFIHGAMCMSYSGRCMMSAYMTGRSANRGDCAQSCRWTYHMVEGKRPGQFFPVEEDDTGMAVLSAHDLNALPVLDELMAAGVSSLKIEGRMKTAYYVATVVNAYRQYLDGRIDLERAGLELDSVSHRPYSLGFYRDDPKVHRSAGTALLQRCAFAGVVRDVGEGRMLIEIRNKIREGDVLELVSPARFPESFPAKNMRDEDGNALSEAPVPMSRIWMDGPEGVLPGDMLRLRLNEE